MRKVGWLILPVALLGLLAFVLLANRPAASSTAFTLKPGDCFDIPGDTQIGDVATVTCDREHDAEVFWIGSPVETPASDPASASTGPVPYPGTDAIAAWVNATCGPSSIAGYTGSASNFTLAVGYFFPDAAAWGRGERQITCYLHTRDGSPLTGSLLNPQYRPTDGAGPS